MKELVPIIVELVITYPSMLKFLSKCNYILFILGLSIPSLAQVETELSIQQGHTADITLITIDDNMKYIATADRSGKVIIWDYRSGSQMYFDYFPTPIIGIQFIGNTKISVGSKHSKIILDIGNSKKSGTSQGEYKNLLSASFSQGTVSINGAKVTLVDRNGIKIKSGTSDYFDQPFYTVAISEKYQKIFVGCDDGAIYSYDLGLNNLKRMRGHLSSVNDLTISPDGEYLFSASSDRSVIKWRLSDKSIEERYSGKSFATFGAALSPEEDKLYFGDELGYLREISLVEASLDIITEKKSIYPLHTVIGLKNGSKIISAEDETVEIGNETYQIIPKTNTKRLAGNIFVNGLGFYRPAAAKAHQLKVSPDQRFLVVSTSIDTWKAEHFRILDLNSKAESKHLYQYIENKEINFTLLSENRIAAIRGEDQLEIWKFNPENLKEVWVKEFKLNFHMVAIGSFEFNNLVVLSADGELHEINPENGQNQIIDSRRFTGLLDNGGKDLAVLNSRHEIHLLQKENGKLRISKNILKGHQDIPTSIIRSELYNKIYSTSRDATVKIWDLTTSQLLVTVVPVGISNAIYVTPDNYYMMTGKELTSFGFKVKDSYVFPEQFDPKYNRPDVVLSRLGFAQESLIDAYEQAYHKRIRKMGFNEEMLGETFSVPELSVTNLAEIPSQTNKSEIQVSIMAYDSLSDLDRIKVWINDVAIFGTNGRDLREFSQNKLEQELTIPLSTGKNKIDITVMNQLGAESFKESFDISRLGQETKPDLYLISIGAGHYSESNYDLTYAAKDAKDLENLYKDNKRYENIYSKVLVDEQVNRNSLPSLREFLMQSDIDDEVIVFYAGHGLLNEDLDYYFATYNMDFSSPEKEGILYDEIEGLLDGIPALRKVLLIDACHSGEIDKEEVELTARQTQETGDIQFRAVGDELVPKIGVNNISELSKSLFTDLRKGTGATVISSAGGMEYAIESPQWKNGLFTYSFIQGIKSGKADLDKNKEITLSEIKKYVGETVLELSNGKQKPTTRIENNALDYVLFKR